MVPSAAGIPRAVLAAVDATYLNVPVANAGTVSCAAVTLRRPSPSRPAMSKPRGSDAGAGGSSSSDEDESTLRRRQQPQVDNSNLELPALFWDNIPEGAEDHPDMMAMKAINDEMTPEERANSHKTQGNNKLKMGLKVKNKHLLRDAVDCYSKGLDMKCTDGQLNSQLLSNRAHVHGLLGNWRRAMQDALAAREADPANVKAYFRGARAALQVGELDVCEQLCAEGQAVEPAAREFKELQAELAAKRAAAAAAAQRAAAEEVSRLALHRRLAGAIAQRGLRVGRPQVSIGSRKPHLDKADGSVHWPALLMYPQSMQQDVVEDMCEHDVIRDHLDAMFGPDAPPLEWDDDKQYSRAAVELYYLSHGGTPLTEAQLVDVFAGGWPRALDESADEDRLKAYGDKASKWVKVDEGLTLGQLLAQPDFVVPGVPLFFVVAKGTEYRQRFLAQGLS